MALPAYQASAPVPLVAGDYLPFVGQALRDARREIVVAQFLADARLSNDPQRRVRSLLAELELAAWRGVEVRVLLGLARSRPGHVASRATALYLQARGVAARLLRRDDAGGLHSKFVVIDALQMIVGSHNWTHSSLAHSREVSVALRCEDGAAQLREEFAALWASGEEVGAVGA